MKKMFLAVSLLSSMAFADQIDLPAGGRIEIGRNVVTCSGGASRPLCNVARNSNGAYYDVTSNGNVVATMTTLDYAIEQVKKLRDAGLCQ